MNEKYIMQPISRHTHTLFSIFKQQLFVQATDYAASINLIKQNIHFYLKEIIINFTKIKYN